MQHNLTIPGWMKENDLILLSKLASYVPENGNILEVGCFVGRSTSSLYYGKKQSVHLEVVDTFSVNGVYHTGISNTGMDGSIDQIKKIKDIANETGSWLEAFKYCLSTDVVNQLTINVTSSKEYKISKNFDMVFIDANHSEEDVLHDIRKYINTDTLLVGDDFSKAQKGVVSALGIIRKEIPRALVVPENSRIWILVPTSGYWKEVFQKNILFL